MKFILGLKLGMSQIFDEKGNVVPVTLIEAGPCVVTQIKTKEKDGYNAVQIGFVPKTKKVKKTEKGKEFKHLREFSSENEKKEGDKINVSIFKEGDKVKVSGLSKGKGFAGVVKKWGFAGLPASHGTKHEARSLGSIGSAFPQRVLKGRKMPGRMGNVRVTTKNIKIVKIDPEKNLIAVKGNVPGRKGALLEIKS